INECIADVSHEKWLITGQDNFKIQQRLSIIHGT
ncbi:hypothetical protein ECTW09195_2163, partial [Escherichia coli TW09195]